MRTRNNSPMKRIAAAVAAVAVLFGTAPAIADPETPVAEVAQDRTWTVTDNNGGLSEDEPAAPASEAPAPEAAIAPSPSAKSEQLTVKPQMNTVTEPELAEDVTFEHAGTTPDGKEEYTLEAKLNLPADETTKLALPLDDISLMRTKGSLDIDAVEDVTIDGTTPDDASVDLFTYPSNPSDDEKALIPDEVTGDVITMDTSAATLDAEAVVTATVYANEKASRDVKWELYRGELPIAVEVERGAAPTVNLDTPVPDGKARIVVQVAGDWNGGGKNSTVPLPDGRLPAVRDYTPGEKATLRLYEPKRTKRDSFGPKEANSDLHVGGTNPIDNSDLKPVDEDWATCIADEIGQCVFEVPVGVHNYYWIGMESASPGYSVIEQLRVGGSGRTTKTGDVLRYAYATPGLKSGMTYYSGVDYFDTPRDRWGNGSQGKAVNHENGFMYSYFENEYGDQERARNSRGSMFQVRNNPPLKPGCGNKKVGILIDTSESMGPDGITSVKGVLTGILGGLANSPTQVGMATFSTSSKSSRNPENILAPKDLSKGVPAELWTYVNSLKHSITDPLSLGRAGRYGDTDWEEGLRQFYNQDYDIVFMITDGNPTRSYALVNDDDGAGTKTSFQVVEAAVGVSNTLKAQGTRVVPIGIPSNWKYNPVDLNTYMETLLGGKVWAEIKLQTNMKVEDSTANPNQQLELSKQNLAAISGPNEGTDPITHDYMLQPNSKEIVEGILDAALVCSITVERRFYDGPETDPTQVNPTPANTRVLSEDEAKGWDFTFRGHPVGRPIEEKTDSPKLILGNPGFPGADLANYYSEFTLNGKTGYESVEVFEDKGSVPDGWVPVKVGGNANAEGACRDRSTSSADGSKTAIVENLVSSATEPATNDFRAKEVPASGGCHYIVYYMKVDENFDFKLNKVNAVPRREGDSYVYDPLNGAEFKLEGLDADNAGEKTPEAREEDEPATPEGDNEGAPVDTSEFRWKGLKPGRYRLTETKPAEDGYVMLSKPVDFLVTRDGGKLRTFIYINVKDDEGNDLIDSDGNNVVREEEVTTENANETLRFPVIEFSSADSRTGVTMKIANTKSGELPKTGGRGVYLQILLSLLIMTAGGFTARRRSVA